ncbi:MAG: DUF3558 family protein [Pseudonocardiaceae bacterium]
MSRGLVAAAAAVAVVLGAGCDSADAPTPPAVGDAGGMDMCTILNDAELSGLGIDLGTREQVDELGVVGCQWIGQPITLSLERDEDTVAEYVARRDDPAFSSFRENTVHGRAGVQLSVEETPNNDCVQLMDGGPVSLSVAVARAYSPERLPLDVCAEALRIAELIEPRLP